MAGDEDFYIKGYMPDKKIQEKVVCFAKGLWEKIFKYELIDINTSGILLPVVRDYVKTRQTREHDWSHNFGKNKFVEIVPQAQTNYYGFIPVYNKSRYEGVDSKLEIEYLTMGGQVIFDRNDGGRLVTFTSLPEQIAILGVDRLMMNQNPADNYCHSWIDSLKQTVRSLGPNVLGVVDGINCSQNYKFALLLYIMRLRWWPDIDIVEPDLVGYVADLCQEKGWSTRFLSEKFNYEDCASIVIPEFEKRKRLRYKEIYLVTEKGNNIKIPKIPMDYRQLDEEVLSLRISEFDIMIRLKRGLENAGIVAIRDLLKMGKIELEKCYVRPRKARLELHSLLRELGLDDFWG